MQTPLRALIVDTEAPDRELLQDMLATHRNVRVVGEANSAPTALSLYETLHPNLLFMDVQMPKGDGFSLLPKLKPLPSVIFVTASDDFAVKAFELDAVDYLLNLCAQKGWRMLCSESCIRRSLRSQNDSPMTTGSFSVPMTRCGSSS